MTAIVWFRNDLRTIDNPALYEACNNHKTIIPIYINDPNAPLLMGDAQTWWLHNSIKALDKSLSEQKLSLCLQTGDALAVINKLIDAHQVSHVYWNIVYEPKHMQRDTIIKAALEKDDIAVQTFNSSLLIDPASIKNKQGDFYKVFTPFWKASLLSIDVAPVSHVESWPQGKAVQSDALEDWSLLPKHPNWAKDFGDRWQPGEQGAHDKLERFINEALDNYKVGRDVPAIKSTSELSPHLHFGEISPQQIWRAIHDAKQHDRFSEKNIDTYLSEVGWREFSYYLLYHYPNLATKNIQAKFDGFPWENDNDAFKAWQKGKTGYPVVDAGMRELWTTGYMHNRVRMIVASFLIKDLFVDWRKGAAWFTHTLLDADLASNSASWQWVAGCGADAAPYFRIFNPILQGEKFDPDGLYVKQWIPELRGLSKKWIHKPWEAPLLDDDALNYPKPIVDHFEARDQALAIYKRL